MKLGQQLTLGTRQTLSHRILWIRNVRSTATVSQFSSQDVDIVAAQMFPESASYSRQDKPAVNHNDEDDDDNDNSWNQCCIASDAFWLCFSSSALLYMHNQSINQPINQSINQSINQDTFIYTVPQKTDPYYKFK